MKSCQKMLKNTLFPKKTHCFPTCALFYPIVLKRKNITAQDCVVVVLVIPRSLWWYWWYPGLCGGCISDTQNKMTKYRISNSSEHWISPSYFRCPEHKSTRTDWLYTGSVTSQHIKFHQIPSVDQNTIAPTCNVVGTEYNCLNFTLMIKNIVR